MHIAVLELALVAITVRPFVDPLAVLLVVLPLALVAITAREFVDPLAVLLVVLPLALVAITFPFSWAPFVDPLAVLLAALVGFASVSHKFGLGPLTSMILLPFGRVASLTHPTTGSGQGRE